MKLAVIGKDVSKSDSPAIHSFILGEWGRKCSYEKVSIPPEEFSLRAPELFETYEGFNVTIPFKGDILPFLHDIKGDAVRFGAVNTVVSCSRTGYNTDGYGFKTMLSSAGLSLSGRYLVLGAGGAGRSCISTLVSSGAIVFAYERDEERLHAVHREIGGFTPLHAVPTEQFDVIVNCTGVGMHESVGKTPSVRREDGSETPVGKELLNLCEAAVDLIYVPAQSEFLRLAEECKKKTVNGASMLFYQAYLADCIFCGREPNADEARTLFSAFREVQ